MPVNALKEFLDRNRAKYVVITHSPEFTAQEIAASAHISGRELAKTVIVKLDGRLAMAVLPASRSVDFDLLRAVAGVKSAELAKESEFQDRFPNCEIGAMPPFGNLYGMDVFADESLTEDQQIAFNAGTHRELVQMAYKDFERLVRPRIGRFANGG